MRDLDLLFKEKREEPSTVSIELVGTWINGGALFAGLLATLKKLFTKKSWLMYTSISSIVIATLLSIFQFSAPEKIAVTKNKFANYSVQKNELKQVHLNNYKYYKTNQSLNEREDVMSKIPPFPPKLSTQNLDLIQLAPQQNTSLSTEVKSDSSTYFDRIDVNGSISFTLINGEVCAVSNLLQNGMEADALSYTIKNGTLFLEGVPENEATVLVITVPDLHKMKINGFCNIVTPKTFNANDLEVEVNGFVRFDLDLNVKDLELDFNGETSGNISVKSENFDFEINGMNDIDLQCDARKSWIEINGFTKINVSGTSVSTLMKINGESKFSGESFISQDMLLKVTGINQKIETTVSKELDVDISGSNNVIIHGSPIEVKQNVAPTSKLKMK
ncbi:MAG: hypothetical protein RLZZ65_1069 [Bacteroidota bacterium]|jgi:hypothetical protein